ncbi:hypothetical protein BD626DRAFT_473646 [Schizophyllum amplum]|uniref:FK506-binding protein n=1 Tax=Schizophyllum amplum TaxID=97359 RepID=A0A550CWZ9_9AGAR|nr:hypothetical protein BD626DRAFT_473646 [Auriculariopsis ampla]
MATAIGIWSEVIKPGTPLVLTPAADLRLCNVSLGETLADPTGRTVVKVTHMSPVVPAEDEEEVDDEDDDLPDMKQCEIILCALTPGKIEQTLVDLVLQEEQEVLIEVIGKNEIHFVGNYIEQPVPFNSGDDEESDDEMNSEDEHDLRFVSSDVEVDPEDLESDVSRFEEMDDGEAAASKSLKRPRASDVMDTDEAPKSKAEKKLKGADGKAVEKKADAEKITAAADSKVDGKDKKSKKDKKKEKQEAKAAEPAALVEREVTGGLKIKDVKIGSGPKAVKGKTVGMRYIGKLTNGQQFDANTKGKPFTFHLGKGEVIRGWDEGIAGMQVGGERILTIPPAMGYGKRGTDGIPGNSTLVFEVKLLSLK